MGNLRNMLLEGILDSLCNSLKYVVLTAVNSEIPDT